MRNDNFTSDYKAALPIIFKAGAAINEIVRKEGKVKPDFIMYADSIKPELLAVGIKYQTVAKLIETMLKCLNYAVKYAKGDLNSRQKCLTLSGEFDALIKLQSGRGDVKCQ